MKGRESVGAGQNGGEGSKAKEEDRAGKRREGTDGREGGGGGFGGKLGAPGKEKDLKAGNSLFVIVCVLLLYSVVLCLTAMTASAQACT